MGQEQSLATLQGTWVISASQDFQGLGVSVSDKTVTWSDPRYPVETLKLVGDQLQLNVHVLSSVNDTSATWKNTSTGESSVWLRAGPQPGAATGVTKSDETKSQALEEPPEP